MKRIETILVPVDLGPPASRALAYAVDLADQLGAKLHVISAYELPIVGFPDGAYVASSDIAVRIIDACQKALDDACAKHKDSKVPLTKKIEQGDPRDVILKTARDLKADLIIMGTHGRTGIARALVGSTAETVIRASEIPVLTVH